ncbi:MAG: hypothetical protein DRN91_08670 [Candidatus Alkanophagales archaeon]|nr:MAG: hypothetical protein DRN91_08670 [Candidatus Alkanophagales archaeon]
MCVSFPLMNHVILRIKGDLLPEGVMLISETLKKFRKHEYVAIFTLAALFTPPDVFRQAGVAGPLIAFYEAGIVAASITARRQEMYVPLKV